MRKPQKHPTEAEMLRQKAEELLKKKSIKTTSVHSEADTLKLIHELQVHQIELEMQNEELRLAKENADEATQKYTELYDFAPSGYFTISKEGEIIELNLYGARMLGTERLHLINKRFGSFVSDQTKSIYNDFLNRIFTSRGIESCEITLSVESKNITGYFHLAGHTIGKGGQCHISVMDITERKKAEKKLKESETKYRDLVENSPDAIIIYQDNKIVFANAESLYLIGAERVEDLIGKSVIEFVHPDSRALVIDRMKKLQNDGNVLPLAEERFIRLDGSEIEVEVKGMSIRFDNKLAVQLIIRNITERKQAESELIKAKEKAEESERLKSAFLTNMSHEIRTPMNGILGFTELLREPNLTSDEQLDYIQTIQISGARMLNTINNIVDISKIESELVSVDIKETNINEKMEFTYKFFKPEVEIKGLQFLYKNGLPSNEAIIKTDNEKVYGILTNLVKNAIKFTYEGSIEFGYVLKSDSEPGSTEQSRSAELEFFVKDTGIGIPKKQQQFIFERFRQGSESHNRGYEGSGLGLSISKSYVEMLGGRIWVESEEGRGSSFYFTIPYNPVLEEAEIINAVSAENKEVEFKKLKILIVEDDEISYSLLSLTLQKISKVVFHAVTGVEAVKACRNNPDLDLVLMDIRMPQMDGLEATRLIRQFNKDLIIIAQTAYGFSGDREKAIEAGCNDYISKPINKTLLLELIKKHTNK